MSIELGKICEELCKELGIPVRIFINNKTDHVVSDLLERLKELEKADEEKRNFYKQKLEEFYKEKLKEIIK